MSKFLRLAAGVVSVGVLALAVAVFDRACQPLSYPSGHPDLQSPIAEVVGRREQLNQLEEALLRRKQARWRVAEAVIAGQLSLAEAIDIFRALDREWPENRPWPHAPAHVEISQDEWDGRGVLNSVRQVLADRPAEAAAAADCLERELQQLLADRKKRPPATAEPRTERSR
jgi:hypothetical protein